MSAKGIAFLVGSGPGNPGLLTLRGAECIRTADVIIYDYLACSEVLNWAPRDCEKIYVGKKSGEHTATQQEINALLVEKTAGGKRVVRLKGGDPFVFGRGGEEAEALAARGLPFEIVPGVTSAVAAPAFAGIPVTHRSCSSSFYVVTGHEDPGKESSAIPWKALAQSGSTLVFLMGVKRMPDIGANLMNAGMKADTPVAIVRWGATSRQRTLVGELGDIAEGAFEAALKPPAVLVVGSVVGLRERIAWFERRPLFGKTVLITRASEQASQLSAALREHGAFTVELPVIAFAPPKDTAALDAAIENISSYEWVVFTSANGVKWFTQRAWEIGGDVRSLAGPRIVAIGPATKRRLEESGIRVDGMPTTYVAEDLVSYFSGMKVRGSSILIARAEDARPVLAEGLKDLGADVDEVPCYRTTSTDADPAEAAGLLKSGELNLFTFTSSSTVNNTLDLLEKIVPPEAIERVPAACIGPITAETARKRGIRVEVVAERYTVEGLVEGIVSHYSGS